MVWGQCQGKGFWCYLFSIEALGVLAWIAFALTMLGIGIAIFQVRQAVKAAKDASTAAQSAERTTRQLSYHIDGVNLAYLSAQMNTIMHLIRNVECDLANVMFAPIKRSIRLYIVEKQLDKETKEALNRVIGKLETQMEWGRTSNVKFNPHNANRHVDELLSKLTEWESDTAVNNRRELSNENA